MKIALSKTQRQFVTAPQDFVLFGGGLGSGKTWAGAAWVTTMLLKYPGVNGVITANSYKQLNRATLATLFTIWDEWGIPYHYREKKGEVEVFGTTIYAVSMDNYDDLRGFEVGWAWSDECAFYKKEAFDVLIGRIRNKKASCQWKGTTTPNGYNWLYETFVEKADENTHMITSSTMENAANLSDSYIRNLRKNYDSKLAEQELDGQFVNLSSGKVYYRFDRRNHLEHVPDIPHAMLYVGLDFNVNPLCGTFIYAKGDKLYVKSEMRLENSNTFEGAKEIIKRYPYQALEIVPDETGNRRKSSTIKIKGAYQTDHEILRMANLPLANFRNPGVKDRYNNLNRMFEQGRIIIDPSCKHLIKDLEQMTYDNNDDMLGHLGDTLGYVAWHLFPMKKPKRPATVKYQ
jgi:PBSX family phage terminase large subunit